MTFSTRSRFFIPLIHLFAWLALFLLPLLFIETDRNLERFLLFGWFLQLLMACYFYYNYAFLIPRFLLTKRLFIYFLLVLAGYILACLINAGYYKLTFPLYSHRNPYNFWHAFFFPTYSLIIAYGLSTAIRTTMEWFRNENQKKEMEAEKLQSELAFLKSQINPHFLFNTLNNICSLARKKSDETENAIITLSSIMRYMLNDSRDETVNIIKEVDYLKSYIELQRLRLPEKTRITFTVEGDLSGILLEPLLLIPFVENAFKFGAGSTTSAGIDISLINNNDRLIFRVLNPVSELPDDTKPGSGIGLKNVSRRLELLYPGKHTLTIMEDGKTYEVVLELQLNK